MPSKSELDQAAAGVEPHIPRVGRVIVDLDLDDRGAQALDWARGFATVLDVPLIAWVSTDRDSAEQTPADEQAFQVDTARSARRWIQERGPDVDAMHIAIGSVDNELVTSTRHGDVVVLGVDTTEGFTGWALGSRSHVLAHTLQCPLIVVPPGLPSPDDAPIVVGVDGNEPNTIVVDWAKQLAHDLHRPMLPVFAYNAFYDTFDNAGDVGAEEHAAHAEAIGERLELREFPGHPARVLTDVAGGTTAYLIVVCARHEHALGGLLLGRVVDRLLHHPPTPIAVITYGTPD
jgi:nucleotide-binding universal stress UspA family protein